MDSGMMSFNDGQIYYQTTGLGEPIVFIHGFSLNHNMWQPQVEFFSNNYQVVTYDVRGFGKSSLPSGPYDHSSDLYALLDYLNIKQAHIVGLSMGGRIAINFTLDHPKTVKTLTLMDSALDGYKTEVDWNVHAKKEGLKKAKENWLNHELFTVTKKQPKVLTALSSMVNNYSGWHWLNNDPQTPTKIHALNRLNEITQPTLILVGNNDLTYFHNIADVLAKGITGSQKIILPNAGHMINMEASDEVNSLLADFIAKNNI
mgnify:CR=1 FL=1